MTTQQPFSIFTSSLRSPLSVDAFSSIIHFSWAAAEAPKLFMAVMEVWLCFSRPSIFFFFCAAKNLALPRPSLSFFASLALFSFPRLPFHPLFNFLVPPCFDFLSFRLFFSVVIFFFSRLRYFLSLFCLAPSPLFYSFSSRLPPIFLPLFFL